MKLFIAVCAILAAAAAKPSGIAAPLLAPIAVASPVAITAPVSSQYHSQDTLGQYTYGYSTALSAKSEARAANGVTVGGYTYIDGEGKLQSVEYSSDDVHGFRVAATNIPVPPAAPAVPAVPLPEPVQDTPEVIEARAKHLATVQEVKARATEIVTPVAAVSTLPVPSLLPFLPGAPLVALKSAAPVAAVEAKSTSASVAEVKTAAPAAEVKSTEAPIAEAKSAAAPAAEAKSAGAAALTVNSFLTPAAVSVKSLASPALPLATAPLVAAPVAYGYSINTLQGLNPTILTQPAITAYTVPFGAQLLTAPLHGSVTPAEQKAAAKEAKESSD